jgi:hypothetical protein
VFCVTAFVFRQYQIPNIRIKLSKALSPFKVTWCNNIKISYKPLFILKFLHNKAIYLILAERNAPVKKITFIKTEEIYFLPMNIFALILNIINNIAL